jgi:anti-anti-sigma regulatory factor
MSLTICETRTGTFRLGGSLDLYAAEHLRTVLLETLGAGQEIAFDLAGVTACDTAGVQLLLAARATGVARGQILRFVAVPEPVAASCARLGIPALDQPSSP